MHPVIRSEKMHLDQHITDTVCVLFESWGIPCYAINRSGEFGTRKTL
jgi:hypothetical protein